MKYVYKGYKEVFIRGVGLVKPGQVFETKEEIKNKDVFVYKEKKKKVKS